ncbi:hypothetical protein C0992_007779 [Termitomyces sp. T32_za158]|nr:hypothetical protein C0992_007779 [Termitomyces sp. T32_za158]
MDPRRAMAIGVNVEHVSPTELYEVLNAASSQDPSQLKASHERLKQMLDMFGTYDALHEIAGQRSVPLAIRQQAIIQFKNAALAHWKSRKGNLVDDLLGIIDVNLQKRYVMMNQDSRDVLTLRRSVKLLNGIIKEFASIKMLNGVKTMANSTVWLWNRIDKVSKEEQEINKARIQEIFQNSAVQVKGLIALRTDVVIGMIQANSSTNPQVQRFIDIFTRHVRVFGKFFRRLQQLSPARFIALPTCSDLILYYWSQVVRATTEAPNLVSDSNQAPFPVRHLVQAMVLFKESLAQWTPNRRDGTPNENALSEQFVKNAVELLVTRFMPLNPLDLEVWVADPEEWVNIEDKENDLWEYEIRAIINLDDDCLTLWLTALRNTLTLSSVNGSPALFDLFPIAMNLLSTNFDLLGKTVSIIESYFLLDAPGILQVREEQKTNA